MPEPVALQTFHTYPMSVTLFGPLRPAPGLQRQRERVIKSHVGGVDYFTDIELDIDRHAGGMVVKYLVQARSLRSAKRVGLVYLAQLCGLLSAVTQCPVKFYLQEEESREERGRRHRETATVNRHLTAEEWSWVTGSLVSLRREHPRFLAAASWFRKGLNGTDPLDDFCCFWRAIERLAEKYADKSSWTERQGSVRKSVSQLTTDLFGAHQSLDSDAPDLLLDPDRVGQVIELRNVISHGKDPITIEMIEKASDELEALEEAAYSVLTRVRQTKLTIEA